MFKIKNIARKIFLDKKEIIIVSENKILTKKITFSSNLCRLCLTIWFCYSSYCFVINKRIVNLKNKEIENLNIVNDELKNNIANFDGIFNNVKHYLSSLNIYDRFSDINVADFTKKLDIINDELLTAKSYKTILPTLNRINSSINEINNIVDNRVANIENLISNAGVSLDYVNDIHQVNLGIEDGFKYNSVENYVKRDSVVKKQSFLEIQKELDYLAYLESFFNSMPLSHPMNSYRITSHYGNRPDPFEKDTRYHKGVDLAGPLNSKIMATSDGTVVFVGAKNGYGNYIKISHKNSVTTEYAHLSKFLVKAGDKVKRGDAIGIQGNTGRSTGQHLHYEIKVNGVVKNPSKFIDVGSKIF